MDPLTAATLLFPTGDHHAFQAGVYAFEVADGFHQPAVAEPPGLAFAYERLVDTDNPLTSGTGESVHLRVARGPAGPEVDRLEVQTLLASLRIRPDLGDRFDLCVLLGDWDEVWLLRDNGRAQLRIYTPLHVTPFGVSNNDMDDANALRWYVSGGAGVGGEVLARAVGPLGMQVRAESSFRSTNRWRTGERNPTRHEVDTGAELGLTFLTERQAWLLGVWGEHVAQWDPRDGEGRDGMDRQQLTAGASLGLRLYRSSTEAAQESELGAILRMLEQAAAEAEEPASEEDESASASPDGEEIGESPASAAAPPPGPLELHWSEIGALSEVHPTLPQGWGGTSTVECSVRFFLDPTGAVVDVRPEACPPTLLPAAMAAAWQWAFPPHEEDGAPVAVQVVVDLPFQP